MVAALWWLRSAVQLFFLTVSISFYCKGFDAFGAHFLCCYRCVLSYRHCTSLHLAIYLEKTRSPQHDGLKIVQHDKEEPWARAAVPNLSQR